MLLESVSGGKFEADEPLDELRFLARAHAQYTVANRELAAILLRDSAALDGEHRRRHQRRERPYIARWIACARRAFPERSDSEVTTATFAALTVLNSVANWPASARKADDAVDLLSHMALGCVQSLTR